MDFLQIAERLQDETVHAAVQKAPDLSREVGLRLLARGRTEGLDPDAQRTHRARHRHRAARRFARQPRRRPVDLLGALLQAEGRELHRVGAERVRFQHLGARLHVRLVHPPDQLGVLQVELVVADAQEDALAVQHRPHRPVQDVDPAIADQLSQAFAHWLDRLRDLPRGPDPM